MGVDEFERWWRVRERADIVRMIATLDPDRATGGCDVCHVRACAELDVVLRRSGRRRLASQVAHRLRLAVVEACRRTGVFDEDRDGAVRLARAAGDAARVLVCDAGRPCLEELLVPFRAEVPLAIAG
jgi:hypothetical protein